MGVQKVQGQPLEAPKHRQPQPYITQEPGRCSPSPQLSDERKRQSAEAEAKKYIGEEGNATVFFGYLLRYVNVLFLDVQYA